MGGKVRRRLSIHFFVLIAGIFLVWPHSHALGLEYLTDLQTSEDTSRIPEYLTKVQSFMEIFRIRNQGENAGYINNKWRSWLNSSGAPTAVHEGTHFIQNALSNSENAKASKENKLQNLNVFIVAGQGAVVLEKSPVTRNQVRDAVPPSLRGQSFDLYLNAEKRGGRGTAGGMNANFNYILDEYASYVVDAKTTCELHSSGQIARDKSSKNVLELLGSVEFTVYALTGLALAKKSIGTRGYTETAYAKMRDFIKEEAEQVGRYLKEGKNYPRVGYPEGRALFDKVLTSSEGKPLRDFIVEEFGEDWLQSVLGEQLSKDPRRLRVVDRSRQIATEAAAREASAAGSTQKAGSGSTEQTEPTGSQAAGETHGGETATESTHTKRAEASNDFDKNVWSSVKAMMPGENEKSPEKWGELADTALRLSNFMQPNSSDRATSVLKAIEMPASSPNYKMLKTILEVKARLKNAKGLRELIKIVEGKAEIPTGIDGNEFRKLARQELEALADKQENKPWIDLLTRHRHPVVDKDRALYQLTLRRELMEKGDKGESALSEILAREKYSLTSAQRKQMSEDLAKLTPLPSARWDSGLLQAMKQLYNPEAENRKVGPSELTDSFKTTLDTEDKKAFDRAKAWTKNLHEGDDTWRAEQQKKFGQDLLLRWSMAFDGHEAGLAAALATKTASGKKNAVELEYLPGAPSGEPITLSDGRKIRAGERIELKESDPQKIRAELEKLLPKDSDLWSRLRARVPEALASQQAGSDEASPTGTQTNTKTIVTGDNYRYYLQSRFEALPVKGEAKFNHGIKVVKRGKDKFQVCTPTYCTTGNLTRAEAVEKLIEAQHKAENVTADTKTATQTAKEAAKTATTQTSTDTPGSLHRVKSLQGLKQIIDANKANGIRTRVMFAATNCGPCHARKPAFEADAQKDKSMVYYIYEIPDLAMGVPEFGVRVFPTFRNF
jgi:hypothetical protein